MKNFILVTCTLFLTGASLFAQSNPNGEAEVTKMWDTVWAAYQSGDNNAMWSYYAENATEVYPDGSAITGLANIKAGYEQFKSMMDGKPTWTVSKPTVRFLTPDVALITSDVVADIKLKGGMQVGGKSTMAIIVHKIKGKWLIEFDSQTPVMQMPEPGK